MNLLRLLAEFSSVLIVAVMLAISYSELKKTKDFVEFIGTLIGLFVLALPSIYVLLQRVVK